MILNPAVDLAAKERKDLKEKRGRRLLQLTAPMKEADCNNSSGFAISALLSVRIKQFREDLTTDDTDDTDGHG